MYDDFNDDWMPQDTAMNARLKALALKAVNEYAGLCALETRVNEILSEQCTVVLSGVRYGHGGGLPEKPGTVRKPGVRRQSHLKFTTVRFGQK